MSKPSTETTHAQPSASPAKRRWKARLLSWPVVAVAAFVLGMAVHWAFLASPSSPSSEAGQSVDASAEQSRQLYTCPMHPQIRLPDPDAFCPICQMALVPVEADTGGEQEITRSTFSPAAMALMDLQTTPVRRMFVTRDVRMVGELIPDETRLVNITAWTPGRLEKLYIDYTGMAVRQGEHMVELYSPDLITAQQEFLQAKQTAQATRPDDSDFVKESAQANLLAAREKLRLLGLAPEQIADLAVRGEARETVTIRAPRGGVVLDKLAKEGQYVQTGTQIYSLADLSVLWVRLEAYESDLPWLRFGQEVTLRTRALPGEEFRGVISFLSPMLEMASRTVKVRVTVDNPAGRLKPGMFVQAEVAAMLDADGDVISPDLAGKWICPMHPEVVRDEPGACEKCGMPLVTAESLGYAGGGPSRAAPPLVVPATAVLQTGTRAVVYVKVPDTKKPTFELREVVLGPATRDAFVIEAGLREGEHVVTRGAFKIDSERQFRGLPGMMNPLESHVPPTQPPTGPQISHADQPEAFRTDLARLTQAYLTVQTALAEDDLAAARNALPTLADRAETVNTAGLAADATRLWRGHAEDLLAAAGQATQAEDIQGVRKVFFPLSRTMQALVEHFGNPLDAALHVVRCPMAFGDQGATWLQHGREVRNPYFGASMLRCGEFLDTVMPTQDAGASAPARSSTPHEHDHGGR